MRQEKNELDKLSSQHVTDNIKELSNEYDIKRLSAINKDLIATLKYQNYKLTKYIHRRLRKGKYVPLKIKTASTNYSSLHKYLEKAYQQINIYQYELNVLRTKYSVMDSIDMINYLQNRAKDEYIRIQNYQKYIKLMTIIRDRQQYQLKHQQHKYQKDSLSELDGEILKLKKRLKAIKLSNSLREYYEKLQHACCMYLQKTFRKHNQSVQSEKICRVNTETKYKKLINYEYWSELYSRLNEAKKTYEYSNKKLYFVTRSKNHEYRELEKNYLKLKERTNKLKLLQNKLLEIKTMVSLKYKLNQSMKIYMSETSKNDFLDLNFDCPLQSSFDDKVVKRWNLQVKKKVKQHDNQDSDRVSVKTMQANEPAQDY